MDVLLLEERGDCRSLLAERLVAVGCRVVMRVADVAALEDAVRHHATDIIVVDLARPQRALVEQVGSLARRHDRPVAVFVEETDPESIQVAVRAGVSSYVVRGAYVDRLLDALGVARARFAEDRALRSELDSARASLADRKLIERAKGRLMTKEGLDEQGAYDALRKIAMRRNCRIVEVARAILTGEAAP
jgi:response regulator NasT